MSNTAKLYEEYLRAPGWFFALLGLMLGVSSGVMTAVGIGSLRADPLISGAEALIFFVGFAGSIVVIVYVMLNSTIMSITADSDGLHVKMGILGAGTSWRWDSIRSVEPVMRSVARHGGRGNIFAPSGRRCWSMFGLSSGAELQINDGLGETTLYFVSSKQADELAECVQRQIEGNR